MDPYSLIDIASDANKIRKFVLGDGLKETISEMVGDIHLEAAKRALGTPTQDPNKFDIIISVITHLQAANAAYATSISEYYRNELLSDFKVSLSWGTVARTMQKNVRVCSIMAICYMHIGNANAAISALTQAEEDTLNIHKHGLSYNLYNNAPGINTQREYENIGELKRAIERSVRNNRISTDEYFIEERSRNDWVVKSAQDNHVHAVDTTMAGAIQQAKNLASDDRIHVKQRNGKSRRLSDRGKGFLGLFR